MLPTLDIPKYPRFSEIIRISYTYTGVESILKSTQTNMHIIMLHMHIESAIFMHCVDFVFKRLSPS